MTNRISTRKVSLRSVCDNDDTLAAIRFIVEYVASPLRVRLLDFLRHFLVAMCDPHWHCEVCRQRWRRESGLAPEGHQLRDRSGVQMLPREQRHNRGHPDISLDMLQEACALVSTSTRPQQRESVMAHFYAMHFAPLLVEAACGPPVDITAHHQLAHHLLQDVLTNLEQHYCANFMRWVRKWSRAVLEVPDEQLPPAPAADDDDEEEEDDDNEEEEADAGARVIKALASLMTAALMGWRELPLTEGDMGGLAVPAGLLDRANVKATALVQTWKARGLHPVQAGQQRLLDRDPLLLVSAAADLLRDILPRHRWLVSEYRRLRTAALPPPRGELVKAKFAARRTKPFSLVVEASLMPLHVPITNTVLQEVLINREVLVVAWEAAAAAERDNGGAAEVHKAVQSAVESGWRAFANSAASFEPWLQRQGLEPGHDPWLVAGFQTQRNAWDGWEFAGFLRTDGAAACVALKKATAAGGSGTDSSPSRGRAGSRARGRGGSGTDSSPSRGRAGSRARGRGGRRVHSSGGSGNQDDDQRGPRGGPGRAPGDNPVPGVVAAGDPLAVFEQATLSPMRIVGVDPGVGNYLASHRTATVAGHEPRTSGVAQMARLLGLPSPHCSDGGDGNSGDGSGGSGDSSDGIGGGRNGSGGARGAGGGRARGEGGGARASTRISVPQQNGAASSAPALPGCLALATATAQARQAVSCGSRHG